MVNVMSELELFEKIKNFDDINHYKVRKPSKCPFCKLDNMRRFSNFPAIENFICNSCGKRF